MAYLLELLRGHRIDYYWDTVYDSKYDREVDYLVVGNIVVLMIHIQRYGAEDIEKIVEGIVNAKTKNEL